VLEVRDLRKQFAKFVAVDRVSFDLCEGETLALLGPNGSGKSTILRCLAGLMLPTSGTIAIGGRDPREAESRRCFSYLPQRVAFPDNLRAREVVEFYCRLRKLPVSRAGLALEDAGIPDRMVREFSGGMIQRLGIAVAMLPDAPLLILDEPTASLDPEGAIEFRSFLRTLKERGKTIIFTSHVLSDVEALADRVAVLVGGRLAAIEQIDVLRRKLTRRLSIEEVYLNYVHEMHSGDLPFVVDDGVRDRIAAAR
jgi:ABC-type multidrug transport system ATPase subunit